MSELTRQPMQSRDLLRHITRRQFFQHCGVGIGSMALGSLLCAPRSAESATQPRSGLEPAPPHHRPRAKAVIFLFMAGGPSQLDLFCDKPELRNHQGKLPPRDF